MKSQSRVSQNGQVKTCQRYFIKWYTTSTWFLKFLLHQYLYCHSISNYSKICFYWRLVYSAFDVCNIPSMFQELNASVAMIIYIWCSIISLPFCKSISQYCMSTTSSYRLYSTWRLYKIRACNVFKISTETQYFLGCKKTILIDKKYICKIV